MDEEEASWEEQENFHLRVPANSNGALEQLFRYLFPGEEDHVYSLCTALKRFTPATLLHMNRRGVGKFLEEMAGEFKVLGVKYSPEEDLRAVHALSNGKYRL